MTYLNSGEFLLACDIVKKLKTNPNNDELLILYGLYKQATVGDNCNKEPGIFDFKAKEKHQAWLKYKGLERYESEVSYITNVNELISKYGVNK